MDTPLTSFKALVKFEFDRVGLTSAIADVRKQLQGLSTSGVASAKKKEQSTARTQLAEWRLLRLHSRALRENQQFDQRNARTTHEQALRDNKAFDLRRRKQEQEANRRSQEHSRALRENEAFNLRRLRATNRQAAIEMRNARQLADFQNREFNLRQRNADRLVRQQQRQQEALNRLHTQANRENRIRDRERFDRLRAEANFMNREFNLTRRRQEQLRREQERTPQQNIRRYGGGGVGGSGGGNPNPWHIAGGSGMLAGNNVRAFGATIGAGAGIKQLYDVANFQIAQEPQFEFLTGSAEEAKKQISFLNKEVDRLGLNLMDTSVQYRQLLASTGKNLGIEKTQELFSSFQNIGAMLGLTTDAQNRGLRAFAQMASKGQVYSEELRGQLSEALP